jgi:Flp pilus assembly CpaF family ATPase
MGKNVKLDVLLQNALRQSPENITIGEVRDPEALKQVMMAMQSGHIVNRPVEVNRGGSQWE